MTEECEPSDGFYNESHPECQECDGRHRNMCKIFAVELEHKDVEDVIESDEEE